ncbi:MAG: hypothetical protein HQ596_04355 [Candidatus Saganbacteria bacterium]|nr:hypothetical protein [Candidatus Saganbacteria bacterium]
MKTLTILGLLVSLAFLFGCGQSSSTPTSDTVTISGSLSSGTISSTGVKASAKASAISDYDVVAVDSEGKTYRATSDGSGDFSVTVPVDTAIRLTQIDSNDRFAATTVMVSDSDNPVMSITPTADTDLGTLVLDSTKGVSKFSSEPTSIANNSDTAVATDGTPKGAGNDGKNENSGITNNDSTDEDQDGIPNLFDADSDNDGVRNGIITTNNAASSSGSSYVQSAYTTSNIWAEHGTTDSAENLIQMRINIRPVSGQESHISSVQVTGIPASIRDVAVIFDSDSMGDPTGYPAEGTLWKDSSYNLYQTTTLADELWTVGIVPKAIMSVGDIFTVRVTYTDSSYEDFFITMSYVLTDWSRIINYNSTTMPTTTGNNITPTTFSTDTLEIEFSKPLDEDGDVLTGLTYSVRYGKSELDGGIYLVPTTTTSDSVTDTGATTLTHTIATTTVQTYYVTPVASSADGQSNGEETWFTRQ